MCYIFTPWHFWNIFLDICSSVICSFYFLMCCSVFFLDFIVATFISLFSVRLLFKKLLSKWFQSVPLSCGTYKLFVLACPNPLIISDLLFCSVLAYIQPAVPVFVFFVNFQVTPFSCLLSCFLWLKGFPIAFCRTHYTPFKPFSIPLNQPLPKP